ncbi:MAG: protein-export chaperone SecB [Alphaproteobacteria bacterium]|nr:protein-export chaperone SecB [Alphaproteobacteria bacterium]
MADENNNETKAAEVQPPKMQVLGQFIRDMSFENVAAQKGYEGNTQPDIQVQVNLDARKRENDGNFEVILKLNIESKSKEMDAILFILEIEYGGVFSIENVPDDQMHPFLMIECPRMIFPYLRRIVGDVTRDGGYPPLNLENIDFLALYRNEIARRVEAEKAGQPIA